MKVRPIGNESSLYAFGTIVGKALESCDTDIGEIEVFVMVRQRRPVDLSSSGLRPAFRS